MRDLMSNELINTPDLQKNLSELGWTKKEIQTLINGASSGYVAISPSLEMQFYELFLAGRSASEISKENPPFLEKDILYLRYKKNWDVRRQEYFKQLVSSVQQNYVKTKLESARFLMDLLAVSHKKYGQQMAQYLQTGRDEHFPEMPSLKYYKEIIEALTKISGEDKKIQIEGSVLHQIADNRKDDAVIDIDQTDFLTWLAEKNSKNKK